MKSDPEAVADAACWPVNECDLHARHLWLANNAGRMAARLMADPDYCEPRAAGWWIWGTMRNGERWERSTAAPRTNETESGLWPTPCLPGNGGTNGKAKLKRMLLHTPLASIATHGGPNQRDSSGRPGLQMAAMSWPTPRSNDAEKRGDFDATNPRNGLAGAVKLATPQARDFRTGSKNRWEDPNRSRNLNDQIGGQLNPTWVEWLMGWPLEWTALKPLETDRFQQWRQQHSRF